MCNIGVARITDKTVGVNAPAVTPAHVENRVSPQICGESMAI